MKAILLVSSLLFAAVAQGAVSYAGTWTLDPAQSRNLPPHYQRVSAHVLRITQDDAKLTVSVTIESADRPAEQFDFQYRLDGEPTRTETMIRTPAGLTPVPTTLRAEPQENGGMRITVDREIKMPNGETRNGASLEQWRLDASGNVLTIDRVDDTPRGRMESTMVFVRK